MGDYDVNLMNYENHTLTADFVVPLHSHSLISLINRPTRITTTTATLIGNIFTNFTNIENSFQGLSVTGVFDHLPICCVDFDKTNCAKEDFIYRKICHRETNLFSGITLLIWTGMKSRQHLHGFTQNYCCYITNIFRNKKWNWNTIEGKCGWHRD